MNRQGIRWILTLLYAVPYVFLCVYGDGVLGTMGFYGLMILVFSLLCREAIRTDNIPALYLGNALSFASSMGFARGLGMPPMGDYFKPLTSVSLMLILTGIALLCQTVAVLLHIRGRKGS